MSKRYRRKRNDFEITGTCFPDLETGPIVILQPDDFDAIEVPWAEFRSDFEEVPAEGEPEELDDEYGEDPEFTAQVVGNLADRLAALPKGRDVPIGVDPFAPFHMTAYRLIAILDAARKSLADPAERCRVGEWLPSGRVGCVSGFVVACVQDRDEKGWVRCAVRESPASQNLVGIKCSDWDAARAKWIADGRPTS